MTVKIIFNVEKWCKKEFYCFFGACAANNSDYKLQLHNGKLEVSQVDN